MRKHRWWGAALLTMALVACGGDEGGGATTNNAVNNDLPNNDSPNNDAPNNDLDAGGNNDLPDAEEPDAAPDAEEPDADEPDADPPEPEPCPAPPGDPAPTLGRWSLSMFHYNIQYVAGGTEGFAEVAFMSPGAAPQFDYTAEEIEDRIVEISFDPVLGILERNPELSLTFELQGYMIDVIRARHPETLARVRALVETGRLELASIHWSDQFFLAFGREDMDESWRRTRASFEAAGLPISPVVFTQEGQFGEGFARWLKEVRPDAVMVMARNLQGFYQNGLVDRPLWEVGDLDVVLPRGLTTDEVDRRWSFFDDGELLATNDSNPYLGVTFAVHEPSVRRYERRLQCEAINGYRVGLVSEYVRAVKEAGVERGTMPPFLDGTWQPRSTRGPLRWMGGAGVWARNERDNQVLTTCVEARHHVLALEVALADERAGATDEDRQALDTAWRELLWGQVSDARGVNPWRGEVLYGLEHCGNATSAARARLTALTSRLGATALRIDIDARTMEVLDTIPEPPRRVEAEAPIALTLHEDGGGRAAQVRWSLPLGVEPGPGAVYRVEIDWPAAPGAVEAHDACMADNPGKPWECDVTADPVAIRVPREAGAIGYRPALGESLVRYRLEDFDPQPEAASDAMWSTVADGLIDLGQPGFFVKDVTRVHLAVGWSADPERQEVVELRDETLPPWEAASWAFWWTADEAAALDLARRNLRPVVLITVDR